MRATLVPILLLASAVGSGQDYLARLDELRQARDPLAVEKLVAASLKERPDDPLLMFSLAEVYASEGTRKDHPRARRLLEQLLAMDRSRLTQLLGCRPRALLQARQWLDAMQARDRLWILSSPPQIEADLERLGSQRAAALRKHEEQTRRIAALRKQIAPLSSYDKRFPPLEKEIEKRQAELQATADQIVDTRLLACDLGALLGKPTELSTDLARGMDWLARQQKDGTWSGPDKMSTIGFTGLGLLALLAGGARPDGGPHAAQVRAAADWLARQQDGDGLIGAETGRSFLYCHAIATIALLEVLGSATADDGRRAKAQKTIDYIVRAKNPGAGWRYYPRDGDSDTSVTGWMLHALTVGRRLGLKGTDKAIQEALVWLDSVTDTDGHCGYEQRGETSAREDATLVAFPPDTTEALTAFGLLSRLRAGEVAFTKPIHRGAADRLLAKPARWDPEAGTIDYYYWLHATLAMRRLGGNDWRKWRRAVSQALVAAQQVDGPFRAVDAWSHIGGPVYATAMCLMSLAAVAGSNRLLGEGDG